MLRVLLSVVLVSSLAACTGNAGKETAKKETPAKKEAGELKRHRAGSFPIASAVEVPSGFKLVYHSGQVPDPIDREKGTYGDTEQQTFNVLSKLKKSVEDKGWSLKDIVKMVVFLVGDPEKGGQMDFQGMMKAYFFLKSHCHLNTSILYNILYVLIVIEPWHHNLPVIIIMVA